MMYKKISTAITSLFLLSAILFTGCNSNSGSQDVSLDTNIDSVSYSLGYQIAAMSLKPQGMTDINPDQLTAGLRAALEDEDAAISNNEMQQIIQAYQMQAQQKAQEQQQQEAEQNAKEGEEFLAENREKEGVQETESGLQYEVLEEGSGASPTENDTVLVNYVGTLLDGTEFDSSPEGGTSIPLNRVIPGWTEGIQLMQEGAKYKFYIPGDLAYGANPRPGGPIGPNETLIFEVELLEVQ